MPLNWRDILRYWLLGQPLAAIAVGQEADTLQFVESGLVYRLPWAMEAIRVRAVANGDTVGDGAALDDHTLGLAIPAIETGTTNRSASILIQAGFNSRIAAIKAVTDTGGIFTTAYELRVWLDSETVAVFSALPDWPTAETKLMWTDFARSFIPRDNRTWSDRRYSVDITWSGGAALPGTAVRLRYWNGEPMVFSADGLRLGILHNPINPHLQGLIRAAVSDDINKINLSYLGPDDLWLL
jgi:hypothetical protein